MTKTSKIPKEWDEIFERAANRTVFKVGDRVTFLMPVKNEAGQQLNEGQIREINGWYIYISLDVDGKLVTIERYPNEVRRI